MNCFDYETCQRLLVLTSCAGNNWLPCLWTLVICVPPLWFFAMSVNLPIFYLLNILKFRFTWKIFQKKTNYQKWKTVPYIEANRKKYVRVCVYIFTNMHVYLQLFIHTPPRSPVCSSLENPGLACACILQVSAPGSRPSRGSPRASHRGAGWLLVPCCLPPHFRSYWQWRLNEVCHIDLYFICYCARNSTDSKITHSLLHLPPKRGKND